MNREELTKTIMMIQIEKTLGLHGFYKKISASRVKAVDQWTHISSDRKFKFNNSDL